MATEVRISGTQSYAKIRSPAAVVIFSVITLGIYGAFWWYFINREMRDLGRARNTRDLGDSPGMSVLALTLGALVIVPAVMTVIGTCRRIQTSQRLAGRRDVMSGWMLLILYLLAIVVIVPFALGYMQSELNKVWRTAGVVEPAEGIELEQPDAAVLPTGSQAVVAGVPAEAQEAAPDQLDRLEKLAKLRDGGAITAEEYEEQKAKILAGL
jgi:hypothetical protein